MNEEEYRHGAAAARTTLPLPDIDIRSWEDVFDAEMREGLGVVLAHFLPRRRWFGAKARPIYGVTVMDRIRLLEPSSHLLVLRVEYESGEPDRYLLPVGVLRDGSEIDPGARLAQLRGAGGDTGLLYESVAEKSFAGEMLNIIALGRTVAGEQGELTAWNTEAFAAGRGQSLEPRVLRAEQSNSSIIYGAAFILKLFRRVEPGINPDLEIGAYLTRRKFPHTPAVAGAIEYRTRRGDVMTAGILQAFVPNQGDAWSYTLRELEPYFRQPLRPAAEPRSWLALLDEEPPHDIGTYYEAAALLGRRTAEMHLALAAGEGPDFAPEPFSDAYRRALAERITAQAAQAFALLRTRLAALAPDARECGLRALAAEPEVLRRCRELRERPVEAMRTRHHGDYHLGQVLWTGHDFVIIDFEGEPLRPLRERRMKRSPLRDIAGMLRSFDYAAQTAGRGQPEAAAYWTRWASVRFLRQYLDTARGAAFLPRTRGQLGTLLSAYLLEKATYEVMYELNNRPDWVSIPLRGILQLVP